MQSDQQEPGETFDIYLLVEGDEDYLFYRIPDDQLPPSESGKAFLVPVSINDDESDHEFLQPVLKLQRGDWTSAGCAAVGSTIYVFGGERGRDLGFRRVMKKELYYFDMEHPEKGWKQGGSMENPRAKPTGFSVNNRVYAVGGYDLHEYDKPLPIEVYNPDNGSWKSKCELPYRKVTDSAFYDDKNGGSKHVLMFTRDQELLVYNVDNGYWGFCPRPTPDEYGTFPETMTVLNGETLFMGGFGDNGEYKIIAYDFLNDNKGGCCPVEVTGLDTLMDVRSDYLLPTQNCTIGRLCILFPWIRLRAIGRNKLALVWALGHGSHSYVNCLKMDIHREEDDTGTNQMKLSAHNGSFSSHIVKGPRIDCCILLKRDEDDEDASEDDEYVSDYEEEREDHGGGNEDELIVHGGGAQD